MYQHHFGPETSLVSEAVRKDVDEGKWRMSQTKRVGFGSFEECKPERQAVVIPETATHVRLSDSSFIPSHKADVRMIV
jgi:hypothetical protein